MSMTLDDGCSVPSEIPLKKVEKRLVTNILTCYFESVLQLNDILKQQFTFITLCNTKLDVENAFIHTHTVFIKDKVSTMPPRLCVDVAGLCVD